MIGDKRKANQKATSVEKEEKNEYRTLFAVSGILWVIGIWGESLEVFMLALLFALVGIIVFLMETLSKESVIVRIKAVEGVFHANRRKAKEK